MFIIPEKEDGIAFGILNKKTEYGEWGIKYFTATDKNDETLVRILGDELFDTIRHDSGFAREAIRKYIKYIIVTEFDIKYNGSMFGVFIDSVKVSIYDLLKENKTSDCNVILVFGEMREYITLSSCNEVYAEFPKYLHIHDSFQISNYGNIKNTVTDEIVKPVIFPDGPRVWLCSDNNLCAFYSVPKLMVDTFNIRYTRSNDGFDDDDVSKEFSLKHSILYDSIVDMDTILINTKSNQQYYIKTY